MTTPDPTASLDDLIAAQVATDPGFAAEWRRLNPTDSTNGFADPTVTDRIAAIIRTAPATPGCLSCSLRGSACYLHAATAVVDAMRAQDLVVLTQEAADEIVTWARADERRIVAEEIAKALEVKAYRLDALSEEIEGAEDGATAYADAARIAREFAAKGGQG